MPMMLWVIGLALLVLALVLIRGLARRRERMGIPGGRLVVADTEGWQRCEREMYSPRLRLVGRPDFVFREHGRLIPVEVKSGATPARPYRSHVLQLAAYCLLIEELEGAPPPYGVIAYREGHFRVDYTSALKRELLQVMDEMRRAARAGILPDGVFDRRCRNCSYRRLCEAESPEGFARRRGGSL